ncbi:MAG TPA: hypothetical protein VFE58_05890 [Tepidisphaeraceae bacterium]|nr:hypothetical protein [Tepidisphaeraceae bacterium]
MTSRVYPYAILSLVVLAPLALSQPATTTQPATTRPTTRVDPGQTLSRMLRPTTPVVKPLQPLPSDTPVVDTTSGKYALAPGAPDAKLVREGTYVVDRTGRLRKTDDGQHEEFVFDSDGTTMQDPPMVILPNLALMQMENATLTSRDRKFRITGMVTEYRGRNCVLLDKAVPVADQIRVNP